MIQKCPAHPFWWPALCLFIIGPLHGVSVAVAAPDTAPVTSALTRPPGTPSESCPSSTTASCEPSTPSRWFAPLAPHAFELSIGVPFLFAKSQSAEREGVSSFGAGIQLGLAYRWLDVLSVSTDFGFVVPNDQMEFSQSTTGGDRTSYVFVSYFSLAAGARSPELYLSSQLHGWRLAVSAHVGWQGLFGKRSISDCWDCHAESVDLNAGLFVEPAVYMVNASPRGKAHWGFSAAGRLYPVDSDVQTAVFLNLFVGYKPR